MDNAAMLMTSPTVQSDTKGSKFNTLLIITII